MTLADVLAALSITCSVAALVVLAWWSAGRTIRRDAANNERWWAQRLATPEGQRAKAWSDYMASHDPPGVGSDQTP